MYLTIKSYSEEALINFYKKLGGKKDFNKNNVIFDNLNFNNVKIQISKKDALSIRLSVVV